MLAVSLLPLVTVRLPSPLNSKSSPNTDLRYLILSIVLARFTSAGNRSETETDLLSCQNNRKRSLISLQTDIAVSDRLASGFATPGEDLTTSLKSRRKDCFTMALRTRVVVLDSPWSRFRPLARAGIMRTAWLCSHRPLRRRD
jgi:hypothetical protein